MSRTLLLTPWMSPHKVISWEMAVRLQYTNKVDVLETYDEEISSPSVTWRVPAVVRLRKPMSTMKRGVKFSRVNVFTRDGFRCQYCGLKKGMLELNYDHVLPRIQGGKTNWTNIVTSCYPCNDHKGSRTPAQAGMKLLKVPVKPAKLPQSYLTLDRRSMPEVWAPYCSTSEVEEDVGGLFLLTGTQ